MKVWEQKDLEDYYSNRIQESLTLDYKAADALATSDGKKKEISKDVSAMANSAGGIIIYGMAEDPSDKTYPGGLDPVDKSVYSKEWLEQVINGNIQPRIDGLRIIPVPLNTKVYGPGGQHDTAYVVEIPQSTTAHQAKDKRYYKRYNFESVMMDDYEIRDVMGRGQHPKIELEFKVIIENLPSHGTPTRHTFHTGIVNNGSAYAQCYNLFMQIPVGFCKFTSEVKIQKRFTLDGIEYVEIYADNMNGFGTFIPLLPKRIEHQNFILEPGYGTFADNRIIWNAFADSAPPQKGEILIKDIPEDDRR